MITDNSAPAAMHVFKQYGYTESEFANSGATISSGVFRIHSTSDSEDVSEEFETLKELQQSNWTVEYEFTQRLGNGTVLFEGLPPEVSE